jgi:putative ABC transport system ATP-binding protein
MSFIQIDDMSKRYISGGVPVDALRGATLAIERGEFLAIVGESGAGKSTLLSLLGGLDRPTGGRLEVDGLDVYGLKGEKLADFRSEYLGFVFQSFQLITYLTSLENTMLPLAIVPMKAREKRAAAMHALERVGLADKADRLPHELSGGEQERVALARAIVNDPPIILADEPTGNLDSRNGEAVMKLLQTLNKEGITIVMVTHNLGYARYAGRTIKLQDGRIVPFTDADESCAVTFEEERKAAGGNGSDEKDEPARRTTVAEVPAPIAAN